MPRPRPPSRIEPLSFPVFGISWFADPSTGRSLIAYTGGGGSARTGIFNNVVIQDGEDATDTIKISTGDQVGVALHIYQNPQSRSIWMIVALGGSIHRYTMAEGVLHGVLPVVEIENEDDVGATLESHESKAKDSCSAVAVNNMTDLLAVGCDSGVIKMYATSDEVFAPSSSPLFICNGHVKSICALNFSLRGGTLLSSAKDGSARVWDCVETGDSLSEMICDCNPTSKAPQAAVSQRQQQILVRGCAFADIEGRVALTVASARRGKAYLFQWVQRKAGEPYELGVRTECSPCPISAMSMSQDGRLLALGSVDGSIILWGISDWTVLKVFAEVHELPVTCIAARPYEVHLQGEDFTCVKVHARSASADSQLGCLTLQRKIPRKRSSDSSGGSNRAILLSIHRLICLTFFVWVFSPLAQETASKCRHHWSRRKWNELRLCLLDEVIVAPANRSGVISPPY